MPVLMFDFAALPPEINSARMYSGPGSGPMMAAAAAWNGLAGQLESVATGSSSVISSLHYHHWSGPASASMAAAATRYMAGVSVTAGSAEQTAARMRAAAAAYETAFAATVPPTAVAANRTQLALLVATDFFGQNAPAIAATEALYAEMWAQDATAMYGYAAAASEASVLTPFQPAPETTNPGGQSAQQAAVAHAATSAAEQLQTTLAQALSAVPQRLEALTTPQALSAGQAGTAQAVPPPLWSILGPIAAFDSVLTLLRAPLMQAVQTTGSQGVFGVAVHDAERKLGAAAAPPSGVVTVAAYETASPAVRGAVLAGAGKAASVGKLSVPQSWSALTQAANPVNSSAQSPQPGAARAVAAEAVNPPKTMAGNPPMAMMGPMGVGAQRAGGTPVFRMRDRRFRMPRPPAAGDGL